MKAHLAPGAALYESRIGLGSVGRDILCFLPEELLILGSEAAAMVLIFGFDALLPNHLEGFERKFVNPFEGEVERGKPNVAVGWPLEVVAIS